MKVMYEPTRQNPTVAYRGLNLVLIAIIAVAFIGFFIGIDYGVPQHNAVNSEGESTSRSPTDDTIMPATNYLAMRDVRLARQNSSGKWRDVMDHLVRSAPDLFAEFTPDPNEKRESLRLRSERRAYNGAPPVVPHSVEQMGADSCMLCHGAGFEIQNRTARQLPHPHFDNCLQCHTPPSHGFLAEGAVTFGNRFNGVAAPFEGERAWTGAPPTVPHTTWMRDDCLACHGPNGWPGMETTHAWRQNCLQCHSPSSVLDLHPPTLNQLEFLPPPRIEGE